MTQILWVPGRLLDWNDAVALAKKGRRGYAYAAAKKECTGRVEMFARSIRLQPMVKAHLEFMWVETDRRTDPDNIISKQKCAIDGLVKAGVLPNDGWAQVESISHSWALGMSPGVQITLTAA